MTRQQKPVGTRSVVSNSEDTERPNQSWRGREGSLPFPPEWEAPGPGPQRCQPPQRAPQPVAHRAHARQHADASTGSQLPEGGLQGEGGAGSGRPPPLGERPLIHPQPEN